ncbi:MAG: tRNA pseudouridine(38-40) synthase TruA [Pseudomonadota bacterium]
MTQDTTRYLLRIEYDGGPFFGWQRQDGQPSVQGALEAAARKLNGEETLVVGAGRTDAGVHATGQAAHLDIRSDIEPRKVADALNFHLRPEPIAVLSAEAVHKAFHARFAAADRHYRYRIINRRADIALDKGRVWRVPAALDADAMNEAAAHLIGRHDFSTFRDAQCQANSPVRTLDVLSVRRDGEAITIICSARSFLHRQVRSMVGSLVEVGRGQRGPRWIADILAARDRSACGPVAPATGLYLEQVNYPAVTLKEGVQYAEN